MDEATRPLPEAIEDEYGLDPPTRGRERWTTRLFSRLRLKRLKNVEPVMIITMAVVSIFGSVQTNAVELQYCKAVLNIYNSSVCLNTTASYFTEMQKYVSTFSIFQVICDSVFPILFSVFVGPWSDKFGRRPVMLSSAIGFLATSCLWVWASSTNLHPNYFLFFGLPSSLSGGTIMTISAMFCYICDITPLEKRAQRLGILQGCIYVGSLIGTLAAPRLILKSYPFTFAVCVFANAVRSLYILFILKESVDTSEAERTPVSRNPFQLCYIKSIYEACYQKQTSQSFRMLISVALLSFVSLNHAFGLPCFFLCPRRIFLASSGVAQSFNLMSSPRTCFYVTCLKKYGHEQVESLMQCRQSKKSTARAALPMCTLVLCFLNFFYCSISSSNVHLLGEGAVFYLFLQEVLGWTLLEYTPLNCTAIISAAFIAFFGTWLLSKFLGLVDMQVINIANASRLFGALTLAFGRHIWLVYIGCILESFSGLYGGMIRVFLSRIIHSDDLGKVFALFGTLDLIAPLSSSLLYNTVYNITISTYPNAIFIVSAYLCLLMTLLTATIVNLHLRSSDGSRLSSTTISINS